MCVCVCVCEREEVREIFTEGGLQPAELLASSVSQGPQFVYILQYTHKEIKCIYKNVQTQVNIQNTCSHTHTIQYTVQYMHNACHCTHVIQSCNGDV